MEQVYSIICTVARQDPNDNVTWVEATYEAREDALDYIDEKFPEHGGHSDDCMWQFKLKEDIETIDDEVIAEEGEMFQIVLTSSIFIPKKEGA